jgi:hypothetical protein
MVKVSGSRRGSQLYQDDVSILYRQVMHHPGTSSECIVETPNALSIADGASKAMIYGGGPQRQPKA